MTDGFHIRAAKPTDLGAVTSCVREAYQRYVALMDQTPAPMLDDYKTLIEDGVVRVASVKHRIVGVIVMWPQEDHFYVDNIAVSPSAQGLGVGSALLAAADEAAVASDRDEIRLYTNEIMTENIGYYPRRGFVETHRAIDSGYRRIYFAKRLGSTQRDDATPR